MSLRSAVGAARETAHPLQRPINCEGRRLSFGAGFRRRDHSWEKRPWPRGAHIAPTPGAEEIIAIALRGKLSYLCSTRLQREPAMRAGKHHQVWIEQCEAARTIRERFGLEASFDYAVGEKLMNFASAAHDHPAFARELPRFVSEVRRMFSADEIHTQLARIEREQIERDAENSDPDEDEVLCETPAMAAERIRQFATIKDLLTADTLGTS